MISPFQALIIKSLNTSYSNGLFLLPDPDSDLDSATNSCTMQNFSIGLDLDSDPLIGMYAIGMGICPWDGDLSLKKVQ